MVYCVGIFLVVILLLNFRTSFLKSNCSSKEKENYEKMYANFSRCITIILVISLVAMLYGDIIEDYYKIQLLPNMNITIFFEYLLLGLFSIMTITNYIKIHKITKIW